MSVLVRLFLCTLLAPAAIAEAQLPNDSTPVPASYRPHEQIDDERPPRPEPVAPVRPRPRADGDPGRVVLMPTAFGLRKGERVLNTYELATFEAEMGVRDGLQIGVQTLVPIGLLALGVSAKLSWEWDHVAIAVHAQAIGAWFFASDTRGVALGGLGTVVSVGNRDHYLSFGVAGYGGVVGRDLGAEGFGAIVPHLGGSLRLGRHARLVVEGWLPHRPRGRHVFELAVILYGARIFGEGMWADLGFMKILCTDCDPPLDRSPVGVPYLSLGRPF